ncbi:MAG: thiamine phosphate synthase [Alphaproteobacteria bacterium]|nr:MAG: thiamine phosphate synthase [Alphaproteobacteria bacterium]
MSDCRLYLISPPAIDLAGFKKDFSAALEGGDVACFQLRLKPATDEEILAAARELMPIAHAHDVAFLINDRPDLARQAGADGVHIGQDDAKYKEARKALGADAIVGVTCHNSKHLAMVAGEEGADYVAFGAFFDTTTKEASTRAEPNLLAWWTELFEVPCVAIGGITAENCDALIAAGADFLAVSSGVWNHADGPKAAVEAFNEKLKEQRSI